MIYKKNDYKYYFSKDDEVINSHCWKEIFNYNNQQIYVDPLICFNCNILIYKHIHDLTCQCNNQWYYFAISNKSCNEIFNENLIRKIML